MLFRTAHWVAASVLAATLAAPVNAGLVNHYTFDTDASDSGSQGRHGTLTGAVIDAGDSAVGGGSLDVTNGFVDLPNMSAAALGQYTVAMWIKIDSDTDFISALYATDGFSASALHINHNTLGAPQLEASINGLIIADSNVPARPTGWIHLAFTHDSGSNTIMYVDGIQVASAALGGTTTPFIDAQVGNWNQQARPFNGSIDDLRIYDEVLTASQVEALATVIPEPASLALVGLGGLLMMRRRR